jgi:CheY-like chemotaxis protein
VDLERLACCKTPEELGQVLAAVARARTGADDVEVWTLQEDGRYRSVRSPGVYRKPEDFGGWEAPTEGTAATEVVPGTRRGKMHYRALPLRTGDTPVGMVALAFEQDAPPVELLARDLHAELPLWSLCLDRFQRRGSPSPDTAATARVGAGLAHTLSNVLQAAMSAVESTRHLTDPLAARVALDDALDALRRAASLTRQLAVLGGTAGELNPGEVRTLVAGLVAALKPQMPAGILLTHESDDQDGWVLLDRPTMEATLAGLIFVARELLGASGMIVLSTQVLEARTSREPRMVVVQVRRAPSAVGRPTPLPGVQSRNPDNQGGDSTGAGALGLTFAQLAMSRHGGDATETRRMDGSVVVTLRLPEARLTPSRRLSSTTTRVLVQGLRILVADDEPAVLRGVARMPEGSGHRVTMARDGSDALGFVKAQSQGFDVALLDLTMPRLAGPALMAALRRVAPRLPVVVMTGYASDEMVDALRQEGVLTVLRKPVEAATLLAALSGATGS